MGLKNFIFYILVGSLFAFPVEAAIKIPPRSLSQQPKQKKTPHLPKSDHKKFVVLTTHPVGMFSSFLSVLGALALYDDGYYAGIHVAFGKQGFYYEPEIGQNWWRYYFEPIYLGDDQTSVPFTTINGAPDHNFADTVEFTLKRKYVHELITRYIRIKPHIQQRVDEFVASRFGNSFVIGVHYRGTDKKCEAPRAEYSEMTKHIDSLLNGISNVDSGMLSEDWKIFVATDEQAFLHYMCRNYGSRVIFLDNAIRSTNGSPVHHTNNNYKKGEDAILDCLLLSKCNYLIKTSSNLSLCSSYFNPNMGVLHVTQRHWHKPLE